MGKPLCYTHLPVNSSLCILTVCLFSMPQGSFCTCPCGIVMPSTRCQILYPGAPLSQYDFCRLTLLLPRQIYAVGGFDGFYRLASVECYDTFSNSWSAVTPLLEAVSSAAVVPCLNKLYVIGGAVDDSANTDKVPWCQGTARIKGTLSEFALVETSCKEGARGCDSFFSGASSMPSSPAVILPGYFA